MKTATLRIPAALLALLLLALTLSGPERVCGFASALLPKDHDRAAQLRQAGLRSDTSQIPALIAALKNPPHRLYKQTALQALAQMGATEALPAIDNIIQDNRDQDASNYAKIAKARLLAEQETAGIANSQARVAAKISRFYAEVGLTPDALNEAAKLNTQEVYRPQPVEVYALRELADILYQANAPNAAVLPGIAQVDFTRDYPSALKVRLTPLSRSQRLNLLVEGLARRETLGMNEYYDMQLVADEGLIASHAIVAKLQEMNSHRNQYKGTGFTALFDALAAIGDKQQAPLLEHFIKDDPSFMGYYASPVYVDVVKGNKRQYAPGY